MYKYPKIDKLTSDSTLFNKNVYFIEPYTIGISLVVSNKENCTILPVDSEANFIIESDGSYDEKLIKHLEIASVINDNFKLAGINEYQIFFDDQIKIVDLVVDGLFVSPGMLNNLLNNNFALQNVLAQGMLNQQSLDKMINDYKQFIIKPMTRFCIDNDKSRPHYARIL